ncbi:facilitated trehalose transporter Tret1-like [Bicyclus anynana]|uniref:Facilitated trehalose transporter Tret1-like n=1 Tax=Bicyclus anynana TaxID=110368 RepID=A0A6J1MYC7_BICAN|nr:facilitated trehalose transporter Tret1-like [Bicyclus anynana]
MFQVLVIFTLFWTALTWGFQQGQITGMISALQKHDESITFNEGQIFLIVALPSLCCVFGILYVAVLDEKLGRRWCLIAGCTPSFVNWLILYYASTFTSFVLSRFLAGISSGSLWLLTMSATTEYTLTKSRGLFLSIVLVLLPAFGTALGHILGILYHWRTLALVGIITTAITVIMPYFCVESPHWLASRGRFEECERSFRKLHGSDASTEHELQLLIKLEYNKQQAADKMNSKHVLQKLMLAAKEKYFWKLMFMSIVVYIYYSAAGKVVFSNLATVMLGEITGTSDVLIYTLVVDGFIFIGTCISCVLIKKMPIRVLLFSSGLAANVILITLSACLYFKSTEGYFQWINVILLALYFIVTNAGPYPVMEVLLGEMFPVELKLYCFLLSSPIGVIGTFVCIITLPGIVGVMGYYGLFLLNSAVMFGCLAYLYVYMPETKGRTMQEIEIYFKTNSFEIDKILNTNEQNKVLI